MSLPIISINETDRENIEISRDIGKSCERFGFFIIKDHNLNLEFLKPNWGRLLTSNSLREGIGCVGAKLIYQDKTIQHSGVILGIGGVAGHCHKNFDEFESGYKSRLILSQEFSALTGLGKHTEKIEERKF